MKVARLIFASALLVLISCTSTFATERSGKSSFTALQKDELLLPANYRNWVIVAPDALGLPKHSHKHVASKLYVEPSSYERFAKTGAWPNKTVIVMELLTNKPAAKGECDVMGLEAAVKDEAGFPETWSYYGIVYDRKDSAPQPVMEPASCVDCDNPQDSVLTMAFPTLRAVINAKPGRVAPTLF